MIDFILHLDTHLLALVHQYGAWVYAIMFLIIFSETGLVFAPFLPGDSLLFVAGALAGSGALQLQWLLPLLMLAAFSGDNCNYWIGRGAGRWLVHHLGGRLINRENLDRTHHFYERHGGKTILFARFLPIFRTFAPFVAGIARMHYRLFLLFSALGSIAWVSIISVSGYFFGNIPVIRNNLTLMTLVIIVISLVPAALRYLLHLRQR